MRKIILTYGIISGIISALLCLSILWVGCSSGTPNYGFQMLIGYTGMLVSFSFIFVAVHSFRKKNDGIISFGKAFKIGILISLISSLFYVLAWEVVYPNMRDFMDKYMAMENKQLLEKVEKKEMMQKDYDAKLEENKNMTELYKNNQLFRMGITFSEIFPVGIIMTLLSSLILKRKVKKE